MLWYTVYAAPTATFGCTALDENNQTLVATLIKVQNDVSD